jgi:hypothetical protein
VGPVVAMGVVIAVTRSDVPRLVSMLISRLVSRQVSGLVSRLFSGLVSRLFSGLVTRLVCVISFVPSIAAVAGGEPHSRNHHHHGRGGSVNVHWLSLLERLSLGLQQHHRTGGRHIEIGREAA